MDIDYRATLLRGSSGLHASGRSTRLLPRSPVVLPRGVSASATRCSQSTLVVERQLMFKLTLAASLCERPVHFGGSRRSTLYVRRSVRLAISSPRERVDNRRQRPRRPPHG